MRRLIQVTILFIFLLYSTIVFADPIPYLVSGVVVDNDTQITLPGLSVQAWDKDLNFDDLLGTAITDQNGSFTIAYDDTYFSDENNENGPDLFLNIYDQNDLLFTSHVIQDAAETVRFNIVISSNTANPVPEPATMLLIGTGIIGLAGFRRRLKK